MKHYTLLLLLVMSCFSCKNDEALNNDCVSPLLPNYSFDTGNYINLNLPQYSGLQFAGNSMFFPNFGVKGIYLYNSGSGLIAVEASDPAHEPNDCSRMTQNGIELSCSCDENKYQLLTGQQISGNTGNCLRVYRVSQSGSIIRIFN